MTQDEEIRRGMEAQRLLETPLLAEAFDAIEQRIVSELRSVDVGARDAHRDLIVTLQLLGAVKRHIETHIQTGRLAEITKESLGKRVMRAVRG